MDITKPYADSETVRHNADGSTTTFTVLTHMPASGPARFKALGYLVGLLVVTLGPFVSIAYDDLKDKKRHRKAMENIGKKPIPDVF
jgi:hypothetical protein